MKLHALFCHRFALNCLLGFLFISLSAAEVEATTYYVDSAGGSDANSGTATNAAWQTLANVNGTTFQPGDSILFKTGGSWTGTLNPQGSGASGNPIVISSYGTNPAMPLINGNGNTNGVLLNNQQYWEINNLEVTDPGASVADTERYGIHFTAADFGTVNHLYVSNCYVHNICGSVDTGNGDLIAKRTGGISVEVTDDSTTATRFNNIIIQNCTISSVTNQGIYACGNRSANGGDHPDSAAWTNRYCSNLIIRGNVINGVCKNAMSIFFCDESCLVEHNVVFNTAIATSGNQIVNYASRGTVFQYNEGYGNNGGNNGIDGCLYDSDLWTLQSVWQYSYSHDEFFGLFINYASADYPNASEVVRYNISRNDHNNIFAFSGEAGAVSSQYIYNNTIYTPANLSPAFADDRSTGHTSYFYNNIFYNLSSTATYTFTGGNNNYYDHNVFYNPNGTPAGQPADANALTSDPMLVGPGTGGIGINTLTGYELESNSPCIDSGTNITTSLTGNPNAGGLDFWGNVVPYNGVTDRGANEWSGAQGSGVAPVVSTQPATGVTASNATLNATVNPGGVATFYYFQYGVTTSYGAATSVNSLSADTNSLAVSNSISGLLPGTLYHFQAVANNSAGIGSGADATFTTPVAAPAVSTQPATSVTMSNATLNATINPGGATTAYYFQFGADTNYGGFTTTNNLSAGGTAVAVNSSIGGLQTNTTYHYRAVAINTVGTGIGADVVFTTATVQPPFSIAQGDLYIYQIGDGNIPLTSGGAAVFIDQFSTNGILLGQVALPTNGTSALIASGNSTTEGSLALSPAGDALTFMGYNTNLNTAFPGMNSRPTAGNNRDVGTVGVNGIFSIAVRSTTAYATPTGAPRDAVTDGNGNYWTVGLGGAAAPNGSGVDYYGTNAAAAQVTTFGGTPRSIGIYGGTLYYTANTTLNSVAASQGASTMTNLLITEGGAPGGFVFNTNLTTVYVADDTMATGGGIRRFDFNGSSWIYSYTFATNTAFGFVTANFKGGGNTNIIYATTLPVAGGGNQLVKFVAAGASSAATLLATAPANENFNGIVFDSIARPSGQLQLTSAQFLAGGAFGFSLTNTSGLNLKVFCTTNVALAFSNWTLLGSMTESPAGSGQYQFTDTQATNGAGFYRIVSGP